MIAKNLQAGDVVDGRWCFVDKRCRSRKVGEKPNGKPIILNWTEYTVTDLANDVDYIMSSRKLREKFIGERVR